MKVVLIAIGFIAAGVIGGVTSDLLRPDQPTAPLDDGRDRIEAELSDLRTLVARQGEEIRALRDAALVANEPARLAGAPALEPDAETAAAANEGEFEDKVAKVLEKKDQEEREARTQRMTAMMAEREKALLKRLQEELGLTDYQSEELGKIFGERRNAMMAIREKIFEGGRENVTQEQFAEMRENMQKSREESEEEIKNLLTADQYEAYQKQDTGGFGRGGFGPGGGGRGR
ncbi:MAG: hypothetical protein ABFS86_15655 [Planctomycetota bacterium]